MKIPSTYEKLQEIDSERTIRIAKMINKIARAIAYSDRMVVIINDRTIQDLLGIDWRCIDWKYIENTFRKKGWDITRGYENDLHYLYVYAMELK